MNDAALLSLGATGERKDVSDVNELGAIPGSGGSGLGCAASLRDRFKFAILGGLTDPGIVGMESAFGSWVLGTDRVTDSGERLAEGCVRAGSSTLRGT